MVLIFLCSNPKWRAQTVSPPQSHGPAFPDFDPPAQSVEEGAYTDHGTKLLMLS